MEKTLRAFQFSKLKTRLDIQCKHISKLSEICKEILLKAKLSSCNQKCWITNKLCIKIPVAKVTYGKTIALQLVLQAHQQAYSRNYSGKPLSFHLFYVKMLCPWNTGQRYQSLPYFLYVCFQRQKPGRIYFHFHTDKYV